MNKLIAIGSILVSVLLLSTGCSVKKIEYEKDTEGKISYRIYENDHWLKTESTGIRGGMTQDGRFEFEAEGMKSSPSEEFNRTMQTYTTAFVQLAQIAAAAYNPSASQAVATAAKKDEAEKTTQTVVVNTTEGGKAGSTEGEKATNQTTNEPAGQPTEAAASTTEK